MEIRNILTFLKVAGTQNFSKAAESWATPNLQ